MPAKYLCKIVDIRAYVSEQEAKVKATSKKVVNRKKRMLKMHKALNKAYEEIDHSHSKCMEHILEKTTFKEELKKSSRWIFRVICNAVTRVARAQNQPSSAHKKILGLKLLLASKDTCWEIIAQSIEFQNKLHQARGRF